MKRSESNEIAERVAGWIRMNNLASIFGGKVYSGTKNDRKFKAVDFCVPRILDGTIKIYNKNFILIQSTLNGSQVVKSEEEMMRYLSDNFTYEDLDKSPWNDL